MQLCRRKDAAHYKNGPICSLHFKQSNYQRNLKQKLLKLPINPKTKKLKSTTVSSLNLPAKSSNTSLILHTLPNVRKSFFLCVCMYVYMHVCKHAVYISPCVNICRSMHKCTVYVYVIICKHMIFYVFSFVYCEYGFTHIVQ